MDVLTPDKIESIALARADSGRTARLESLRPSFASLPVGSVAIFSDDDLKLWNEKLPTIVHNVKQGTTLDKNARKVIAGISAAVKREMRAATKNENADCIGGFYTKDGATVYGVKRTK